MPKRSKLSQELKRKRKNTYLNLGVEECESEPRSWMDNILVKSQFLEPKNKESKSTKHAKNDTINNLAEKHPCEIFEQYVNAESKLKILEKGKWYVARKNTTTSFSSILLVTGFHSLPWARIFWQKEDDIGLSIVCEAISRKKFKDLKSFILFANNNSLDTSDNLAKVKSLYYTMNKNLKQFGFLHTFYSIDKQIIPYTGKNRNKKTIRRKSICFGYKNVVYTLQTITPTLFFHNVVLNMVEKKYQRNFVPDQLLIT